LKIRQVELSSPAIEKKDGIYRIVPVCPRCDGSVVVGSRRLALALFSIVLVASVATYLHHATDTLNLSF
jgi:hypothetical protein